MESSAIIKPLTIVVKLSILVFYGGSGNISGICRGMTKDVFFFVSPYSASINVMDRRQISLLISGEFKRFNFCNL